MLPDVHDTVQCVVTVVETNAYNVVFQDSVNISMNMYICIMYQCLVLLEMVWLTVLFSVCQLHYM